MIYIGIDLGIQKVKKNTGFAVWDSKAKEFDKIITTTAWQAIKMILEYHKQSQDGNTGFELMVIIEDARKRKWYGKNADQKRQGAGYSKAMANLFEQVVTDEKIPCRFVAPKKGTTKWSVDHFKRVTGWQKRTSEDARDAAVLVFGR